MKNAIVTGAAAGIGACIARHLLARGVCVLAVDRDVEGLECLRVDSAGAEGALSIFCADLAAATAAQAIVEHASATLGRVDVLVNNAGISRLAYCDNPVDHPTPAWQVPDAMWDVFLAVNAMSAIRLTNLVVPSMLDSEYGRIVNVTTSLDSMINPGSGPYGASKAALEAYTASIGSELKGRGVTANVLIPGGATATAMIPHLESIQRSRLLSPEVLNAPLDWLLSDDARDFSGMRVRANLWAQGRTVNDNLMVAAAPAAWRELAQGQRRPIERVQMK